MPLANYTTKVPVSRSAAEIMAILAQHGARGIGTSYDSQGNITGLVWFIEDPKFGKLPFQLPIRPEAVKHILEREHYRMNVDMERAKMVAWRILRDWIRAQMALLETEMVRLEEIFLPYLLTSKDTTMYETLQKRSFILQLPEGQSDDRASV